MATRIEIGKYLAHLRSEAGLKQNELAGKAGWSASVLSRIESGERPMSSDELATVIEAIGTTEAMRLHDTLARDWQNLEAPPLGHPNEALLWEAESTLQSIQSLLGRQDIRAPFVRRLKNLRDEIHEAASFVHRTEHNVAFVGNIGVGKSTAICRVTGLMAQNERTNALSPVLDVGGGGVTICEVHIVQGSGYGVVVEPRNEDEIHREVREFAKLLKEPPEICQEDDAATSDSFGTSKEIERAIRNMSDLIKSGKRVRGPDGRGVRITEDPAADLAEKSVDADAFALEILARMNLANRTRRELWYPDISAKQPLLWLKEIFSQVNNGRHPEFSIPKRIEVIVPQALLNEEALSIRVVDTKGIDRTAVRRDLEDHFRDPNTLVVLCSSFNDAPSPSVQQLLERAAEGRLANLEFKTAVLALPRPDEALAVKDDQGFSAENAEEGYDLKGDQIEMRLKSLGVPDVRIEFFNANEDDANQFGDSLLDLVNRLRAKRCEHLSEVICNANGQIHSENAEAIAAQRDAASSIKVWIENNNALNPASVSLDRPLMDAINSAHASSLRASVIRQGDWHNLEYSPQLGFGARRMAIAAVESKQEDFKAIAENILQNPELKEASGLVRQVSRMLDAGIQDILDTSQLMGTIIYTGDMKSSSEPWERSNAEWGKGPGYRDRVSKHHKTWFESKDHQTSVNQLVKTEWQKILEQMLSILEIDE